MSVGAIAKKMLGYADEFMEGASKGIGDAGAIKMSVNKMASNMTGSQLKFAKKGKIIAQANHTKGFVVKSAEPKDYEDFVYFFALVLLVVFSIFAAIVIVSFGLRIENINIPFLYKIGLCGFK